MLAPCASLKMTLRLEGIFRGAQPNRVDVGLLKRLVKCGEVDVAREPFVLVLPLHRFHRAFGQRWRRLLLTFQSGGAVADFRWRSGGFRRVGRRQRKSNDAFVAVRNPARRRPERRAARVGADHDDGSRLDQWLQPARCTASRSSHLPEWRALLPLAVADVRITIATTRLVKEAAASAT